MIPEFITDIKVTMKEGTEPLYNTMEFMSHENPHTQTRTNTHKTPEVPPSLPRSIKLSVDREIHFMDRTMAQYWNAHLH